MSLELARRVAAELMSRPDEVMGLARENLARWRDRNRDAPSLLRCYAEWSLILDRGVEAVRSALLSETDEGQRLRQNSPFAGVVPYREVWEIKRRLKHDQTAA